MTAAEAVRRYHAAEKRLAEVEKLIEEHRLFDEWDLRDVPKPWPPPVDFPPHGDLASLYLERDRLQAESFRVFTESRRESGC